MSVATPVPNPAHSAAAAAAPGAPHDAHDAHVEHGLSPVQQVRANRLGLWLFCFSELFLFGALFTSRFVLWGNTCLLYTSPSPRDRTRSRMPSSA
mgnify:CR=1 FL=1